MMATATPSAQSLALPDCRRDDPDSLGRRQARSKHPAPRALGRFDTLSENGCGPAFQTERSPFTLADLALNRASPLHAKGVIGSEPRSPVVELALLETTWHNNRPTNRTNLSANFALPGALRRIKQVQSASRFATAINSSAFATG